MSLAPTHHKQFRQANPCASRNFHPPSFGFSVFEPPFNSYSIPSETSLKDLSNFNEITSSELRRATTHFWKDWLFASTRYTRRSYSHLRAPLAAHCSRASCSGLHHVSLNHHTMSYLPQRQRHVSFDCRHWLFHKGFTVDFWPKKKKRKKNLPHTVFRVDSKFWVRLFIWISQVLQTITSTFTQ